LKTIAIIGSAGIPAKYGGFETLAENLVKILHPEFKFIVFCSKNVVSKNESIPYKNVEFIFLPFPANGLFSIFYDIISLCISIFKADTMLVLGCPAGIVLPFFRVFKKIIFHSDGIEWKRQRWHLPVRLYLYLSSRLASLAAHHIIADNEKLIPYIPKRSRKKISVISYGGEHVHTLSDKPVNFDGFLVISRAVPENNLEMVLNAFIGLPQHHLFIVSHFQNTKFGRYIYKRYKRYPNIEFTEAVYDKNKLAELRHSGKIYIHGHSAGGTNPSLVEAMWSGMPVICHDNIFNRQTTQNQAFYFQDTESLIHLTKSLSAGELKINAGKMLKIAQKQYTWKLICTEYSQLFMSF
jgi:glycosyltransferase involved in cell wall biosynthesis